MPKAQRLDPDFIRSIEARYACSEEEEEEDENLMEFEPDHHLR